MHTCACGHPLVALEPTVAGRSGTGATDCPRPDAEARATSVEWRSVIGTAIVALSGATALIGSLVHYLR